jgi:branched-chain amino acid transport system ATP-binding protein
MSAAIELRGIEKRFGDISIIKNINLSVAQGERHALIGPNGAGKSTTFNLISGYMAPSAGCAAWRLPACRRTRSTAAACRAVFRSPTSSPI